MAFSPRPSVPVSSEKRQPGQSSLCPNIASHRSTFMPSHICVDGTDHFTKAYKHTALHTPTFVWQNICYGIGTQLYVEWKNQCAKSRCMKDTQINTWDWLLINWLIYYLFIYFYCISLNDFIHNCSFPFSYFQLKVEPILQNYRIKKYYNRYWVPNFYMRW